MIDEKTVHVASNVLRARDSAKRLLGEKYKDRVNQYLPVLNAEMERSGSDNPLEAAIDIATRYEEILEGIPMLLLFSAAIEYK